MIFPLARNKKVCGKTINISNLQFEVYKMLWGVSTGLGARLGMNKL